MKIAGFSLKIPQGLFDTVYTLPPWQKVAVFVVSWAIPIAAFWFLFMSSRLQDMGTLRTRIPSLKQQVAVLEAKEKQLPKLKQELEAMEAILAQAVRLLPETKDIPSVLTEISSLGNEAHLDFLAFNPQKEQIKTFYAAIPVQLSFRGPFNNTVSFFDKISHMARIVHIDQISMGGAQQSSEVWSLQSASQGAEAPANQATQGQQATSQPTDRGAVQRGSTLVINTQCQAITYRFLTPEEQKAMQKAKTKKGKR